MSIWFLEQLRPNRAQDTYSVLSLYGPPDVLLQYELLHPALVLSVARGLAASTPLLGTARLSWNLPRPTPADGLLDGSLSQQALA